MPLVVMGMCCETTPSTPMLCPKCAAHAVRSKEATPELVGVIANVSDNMGHARVVKGGSELAMKAPEGRAKELRSHPTVLE